LMRSFQKKKMLMRCRFPINVLYITYGSALALCEIYSCNVDSSLLNLNNFNLI
jgi:hypothetical protein